MRLPDWEAHLVGALTDAATNEETSGIVIYRSAHLAIPRNALAGAYPICRTLVGDDCFNALVRDTSAVQASTSPNLYHYGNALPDVIAQSPLAHSAPYLADVTRLKWCVHWAHYAPNAHIEAADATLLVQSADTIRAGLAEGTQWIVSPWPVVLIWRAHQPGETIALSAIDPGVSEAATIAVRGHRVAVVDLDPPTATFLAAYGAGTSLQATLETTLVERPDFNLTACLSGLYRSGLLALSACSATLSTGDTP